MGACKLVQRNEGFPAVKRKSRLEGPHSLGIGRNATVDSAGKIHCSGVAVAIMPAPPSGGESLAQSVSHLQPDGGASKGSEAGCKT